MHAHSSQGRNLGRACCDADCRLTNMFSLQVDYKKLAECLAAKLENLGKYMSLVLSSLSRGWASTNRNSYLLKSTLHLYKYCKHKSAKL